VAFIRRKKVHGHEYYQAVHNYRDGAGKHRQKVLCHLGRSNSFREAIAAERKEVKVYQKRAFEQRREAEALRIKLLDLYGPEFVDGEIPSEAEAWQGFTFWYEQWEVHVNPDHPYRPFYSGLEAMEIEEANIEIQKYSSCLDYHDFMGRASDADRIADAHQAKLNKLLRVQREYF
jgi:hypothetical protein